MKSFFEGNLSLLSRLDPELAERMRGLPWPQPGLTAFEARSGAPSLKAISHDGVEILLHSEYDPVREARQFLDVRKLEKHDAYLINGVALGYHALAAGAELPAHKWIGFVEAHEGLFRAALECLDLTGLFRRPRVGWFVGQKWALFQRWLNRFLNATRAINMGVIPYPPCLRLAPSFYAEVSRELETGALHRTLDWNTLVLLGREIDRNAIRNLVTAARSHGAAEFKDLFAGVPAVVVGAGPSLNTAIPDLHRLAGKAVVVSVGRALKRLVREGIVPHFVLTLDMGPLVMAFFREVEIPPGVAHLFDLDSYYGASASFPGPNLSYQSGDHYCRWSSAFLGNRGSMEKGNTVAQFAFQFAHYLGSRPILLVGVDLAYPGEQTHADGVPNTGGGKTEEQDLTWVEIPGVQGKPVRSDALFASYVTGFEMQIAANGAQVIQTSEIGARIRGAEHLPLSQAVDRYAKATVPLAEKIQSTLARPVTFDRGAFEACADRLRAGLERTRSKTEEGLHLLSQVRRLDPTNRLDQEGILKKLGKAKKLEAEVVEDPEISPFLGRLMAKAFVESRALNLKIEELAIDDPERLRLYTKISEIFFSDLQEAVQFIRSEFEPVRERILREHASGEKPGGAQGA